MPNNIGDLIENVNTVDGSGGAYAWLLSVLFEDNSIVHLTNNGEPLTLDDDVFQSYPFTVGQISEDGSGEVTGVPLTAWDGDGELASRADGYRGFDRWRVTLRFAVIVEGEPSPLITHRFRVSDLSRESGRMTLSLGDDDLSTAQLPHNFFDPARCQVPYRGTLCGYAGELMTCDRSIWGENGCNAHQNLTRFRGVPGLRSLV